MFSTLATRGRCVRMGASAQGPVCRQCKYFKPDMRTFEKLKSGYCTRMPALDMVSGEATYPRAKQMRDGECGAEGRYYSAESGLAIWYRELDATDKSWVAFNVYIACLLTVITYVNMHIPVRA